MWREIMAFKLREVDTPLLCWKGYRRKSGTKKFSKGSCVKIRKKKK
tara:strand:- start:372 stop:509 length:138 start_codon:yes stop_codon:yes gene_type:complete